MQQHIRNQNHVVEARTKSRKETQGNDTPIHNTKSRDNTTQQQNKPKHDIKTLTAHHTTQHTIHNTPPPTKHPTDDPTPPRAGEERKWYHNNNLTKAYAPHAAIKTQRNTTSHHTPPIPLHPTLPYDEHRGSMIKHTYQNLPFPLMKLPVSLRAEAGVFPLPLALATCDPPPPPRRPPPPAPSSPPPPDRLPFEVLVPTTAGVDEPSGPETPRFSCVATFFFRVGVEEWTTKNKGDIAKWAEGISGTYHQSATKQACEI